MSSLPAEWFRSSRAIRGGGSALVALFASIVVIAVGAGDAAADSPPTAGASPVGSPISWAPCERGTNLQCARVQVPLDWDHSGGPTIELAVIRHLASDPSRRIGTMFVNPGGPGESGVNLLQGGAGDGIDAWGAGRFDVVSWDPRGTNSSTPVRCFRGANEERAFWEGASIPTTRTTSNRFRQKTAVLARRCHRLSGSLLAHISTADSARDLDYLRGLVGDTALTYAGFSYGSFLGQTYANLFPDRVRAMMLDGIVDAVAYSRGAESRVASSVSASDSVFSSFLALCGRAGRKHCALAGRARPVAKRVWRLFARARRASIPAPGATPPGGLGYGDLLLSQFAPLRNPGSWPGNAKSLEAAVRGNGSALETEARSSRSPAAWSAATTSAAVSCADAGAREGSRMWPKVIGRLARISRLQGIVQGWWLWAPCASWRVRGQDSYRGPWAAPTPNPILLIGTRNDPSTPYRSAVRTERRLGNAVLLSHDGFGHISYQDPSTCIERARVVYFVSLETPAPGTVCRADQLPFNLNTRLKVSSNP